MIALRVADDSMAIILLTAVNDSNRPTVRIMGVALTLWMRPVNS